MKTSSLPRRQSKSGVALIIVLGLLLILTLLAVAFAISMRVERLAARNYADGVRAEQFVQVCLARAMEDVNANMVSGPQGKPVVYPDWENLPANKREAMGSVGIGNPCTNLLSGEATNLIPGAVWQEAHEFNQNFCRWNDVKVTNGARVVTYGRIAYLVANTSGLLDANYAGGLTRTASTSIAELDMSWLGEFHQGGSVPNFISNRTDDVRFETLTELLALNTNRGPVDMGKPALKAPIQNLFVYSLDIGRDQYFTDRNNFGTPAAVLTNKFNVNAVTNYYDSDPTRQLAIYNGADFQTKYFTPLQSILKVIMTAVVPPADLDKTSGDVAWEIINWIDQDRYPQGATDLHPEWHSESGESMPLIDEIVYQKRTASGSTQGEFAVELWYPFVGMPCGANYSVTIETQQPAKNGPIVSTNIDIPNMDYFGQTGPQFLVVTSAPLPSTSNASIRVSTYLGLSADASRRIVDRAMDRDAYTDFTIGKAMAVDDPRSNGKIDYWMTEQNPTLGRINDSVATATVASMAPYKDQTICQPWKWSLDADPHHLRQGLPILIRNGPMQNIADLGSIFLANRENVAGTPTYKWFWSTIDLMHRDEGAYLLDHLTVRATNTVTRGLVSISTQQPEILEALLYGSKIGYPTNTATLDPADSDIAAKIQTLQSAIVDRQNVGGKNYICFQDLFDGETPGGAGPGGPIADAFRDLAQTAWSKAGYDPRKANDTVREGPFGNILDLITFRQNIFTIILAAQILGPDESTPIAEKRAVATVYRDAYTGKYFVRAFKWLND